MNVTRMPRRGGIFLGIAAASFGTGPALVVLITIGSALTLYSRSRGAFLDWDNDHIEWSSMPMLLGVSSLFCLVGSIPAACLNAFILHRAARNSMDAFWVSMISGAAIGTIALVVVGGIMSDRIFSSGIFDPRALLAFGATGACMGLLHWAIAIRPRRKLRKRLEYDVDAIQAME